MGENKTVRFELRLSPSDACAIDSAASQRGVSRAEVVRQAVTNETARALSDAVIRIVRMFTGIERDEEQTAAWLDSQGINSVASFQRWVASEQRQLEKLAREYRKLKAESAN